MDDEQHPISGLLGLADLLEPEQPDLRNQDALRLAAFIFVLLDPTAAAIGVAALADERRAPRTGSRSSSWAAASRSPCSRWSPGVADPILDWLRISSGAAELAAGLVVIVPTLDLLWHGPAGRVTANPGAGPVRLGSLALRRAAPRGAGRGRGRHRVGRRVRPRPRRSAARSSRPW